LRVGLLFIRRQALKLLKAVPRRDGLWDAENVARIANELLEIKRRNIELQIEEKGEQKF
jgi:hypothetical protein